MNDTTFLAFGDEFIKIAFIQKLKNGLTNALKEGWSGPDGSKNTWMGQGLNLRPGQGRLGRTVERATSLGGLTKALPVGAKTMMLAGTGVMAAQALRKQDPTGMERSRAERITGLAGNTAGGLVGSALGARRFGMLGAIGGGILGGMAGEKVTSAPFAAMRHARMQQPQAQQPVPQQYEGVPA